MLQRAKIRIIYQRKAIDKDSCMDILTILERFGVPVVVAMAFGFFIWKQNKYIQDDLTKDIHTKFNRLEGIIIKLIDQQKKMQIEWVGSFSLSYF